MWRRARDGLRSAFAPPASTDDDAPQLFPAGHFYSPIASIADVRAREREIFSIPAELPGIDLDEAGQLALIETFRGLYGEQPFSDHQSDGTRYYFENEMFSYGDGLILYSMLRWLRPRRYLEIGSGFSSALVLDVNDRFLDGATSCVFVDPYPDRLHSLLKPEDGANFELSPQALQDLDRERFSELERGDVLFIDSTHVSKVGSDVNLLVFDVLPRLAPGVVVHVHDIFYPFEYPQAWVYEGRGWNEAYLLRAFLSFNPGYRILLFNSYLDRCHHDAVASALPLWSKNPGGSLWLQRV